MHLRKRLWAILVLLVLTAITFLVSTRELAQDRDKSILQVFEKKKESIYFWYNDENMSDYVNSAAVKFGKIYDVRVFPQLVSESQYLEAINHATLYSEHMPDVFLISNDSLEKAYLAGLATPVEDVSQRMNTIHFPQIAIDAVTYKGKQVAYPLFFETSVLLYNETFLKEWALQQVKKEAEEAGRAPNETAELAQRDELMKNAVPKTIDDILKIADTFDPPETVDGIFRWDVSDIFYNYYFVGNYMTLGGVTGDDKTQVNLNNPEVIACLEIYKALNQFFYIEADAVSYANVLQDFIDGKIVFTIATTDALAILDEAVENGEFSYEYKVAPLPDPGEELKGRALSVTGCVAVNGYSEKKLLAEQFAAYLTTDYTTQLYDRSKKMAVYNLTDFNQEAFLVYREEYENSVSLPKMIETGNYWVQLEVLFSKVWNEGNVTQLVTELSNRIHAQVNAEE